MKILTSIELRYGSLPAAQYFLFYYCSTCLWFLMGLMDYLSSVQWMIILKIKFSFPKEFSLLMSQAYFPYFYGLEHSIRISFLRIALIMRQLPYQSFRPTFYFAIIHHIPAFSLIFLNKLNNLFWSKGPNAIINNNRESIGLIELILFLKHNLLVPWSIESHGVVRLP